MGYNTSPSERNKQPAKLRSRGTVRTSEILVVVYLPFQVGYTKLQVAIDKTTVLIITTTVLLRTSVYICTTIKAEVTMDYSPGYIIPDSTHGYCKNYRNPGGYLLLIYVDIPSYRLLFIKRPC